MIAVGEKAFDAVACQSNSPQTSVSELRPRLPSERSRSKVRPTEKLRQSTALEPLRLGLQETRRLRCSNHSRRLPASQRVRLPPRPVGRHGSSATQGADRRGKYPTRESRRRTGHRFPPTSPP